MPPQNPEYFYKRSLEHYSETIPDGLVNEGFQDWGQLEESYYEEASTTVSEKDSGSYYRQRSMEDADIYYANLQKFEMSLYESSTPEMVKASTKKSFPAGEHSRRLQRKVDGVRDDIKKASKEKREISHRVSKRREDRRSKAMSRMII